MQGTPLFSVVIAAYNCESTVESAVRSALDQTEPSREVIVVDDGSVDGTATVVESIADDSVRLIRQENRGSAGARNAGAAASTGRFVAFLDGDDLWLPTYLEAAGRALSSAAGADIAYTDAYAFDGATGRVRVQTAMHWWQPASPPADSAEFLLELLKANFIYNSVTIEKAAFDDVGGFDETIRTHEDYDLWLRLALGGHRVVRMDGPQALYRMHADQKSRNQLNVARAVSELLNRIPMDELPSEEHRTMLAQRRSGVDRRLRILEGEAPVARLAVWPRYVLSRIRLALGARESWYSVPPDAIVAAFPDLTSQ